MSSILEALKKLEEEKAARRGGIGNIASRVTSTGRRRRHGRTLVIPAAMAATALVAIIATYAVMGGLTPRASVSSAVSAHRAAPVQAPAVPLEPAPDPATAAPQGQLPAQSQQVILPAPAAQTASLPAAAPMRTVRPAAAQKEAETNVSPAAAPTPTAANQAPALKVTGIAWQKDEASRLAVVNGSSVSEGSVIEGAVVLEILPDHVRFAVNSKQFDVYMGKAPQ